MVKRSREVADTPQKGQKRYCLYKAVIDKYQEALDNHYYLEAITLMESLIADRLESAIIHYGLRTPENVFLTLGASINEIKRAEGLLSDDLLSKLDSWRESRNQALHEMAKIEDGDSAQFNQRYACLKQIAKNGYDLFKSINEETR